MGKNERELYKDEIVQFFSLNNYNLTKIAEELKINRLDVKKVLIKEGLYQETRKYIDNDVSAQKEIIRLYQEGNSIKKIIKIVGYSGHPVKRVLKENNVKRRNAGDYNRRYTLNRYAFLKYTPESVYWAGFIAGDGCVYNHGIADKTINNYLNIGLAIEDETHLEKFKNFLQYTGIIYIKEASAAITVNSKKIVKDLEEKYNITNNKSNTYVPPETIPSSLIKYFILGLFDSDGSISKSFRPNKNHKHINGDYIFQINFTGTRETCEFIKRFLSSPVKLNKRHNNSSNNYTIVMQGNKQIIKYLNMLYDENSLQFCLDRKLNLFKELIKQYSIKSSTLETV